MRIATSPADVVAEFRAIHDALPTFADEAIAILVLARRIGREYELRTGDDMDDEQRALNPQAFLVLGRWPNGKVWPMAQGLKWSDATKSLVPDSVFAPCRCDVFTVFATRRAAGMERP